MLDNIHLGRHRITIAITRTERLASQRLPHDPRATIEALSTGSTTKHHDRST
jgi:hypothetical protein